MHSKSTEVFSNLLKKTVKAAKTLLKAPKRIYHYFPMQKVKLPVLTQVSEDVISNSDKEWNNNIILPSE